MGYKRLQQVTEWLQLVKAGSSLLPSGYSGYQQITAGLPSGNSGLQQITDWLQWVSAGYSGLQQVTASYRVVTVG